MSKEDFFDVEEKNLKEKQIEEKANRNQKRRLNLELEIGEYIPNENRLFISVLIELLLVFYLIAGLLGWVPLV